MINEFYISAMCYNFKNTQNQRLNEKISRFGVDFICKMDIIESIERRRGK